MSGDYTPPTFAQHLTATRPDVLYHYTGQAGLLGIVEKCAMWATKIQYMNDATEFNLALSVARKILFSEIEKLNGEIKNGDIRIPSASDSDSAISKRSRYAELLTSIEGLEQINIFALCFCENGDLLSQWRGYAGGSHGYSLGFDSQKLKQVASRKDFILGKCIYDVNIQNYIVNEAIELCVQDQLSFPPRMSWGRHGPLAEILFRCGAFFKNQSFAEEQEWRLVSPTTTFRDDQLAFRTGRLMITPYYALPIACEGILPLRHVVVGPCPHMDLAKSAVTSLLMQHGLLGALQGQQIAIGSKIPFRNW
jgi:hypothetical protein